METNVLLLSVIFIAEVRAANERLYPSERVRIVISREDAMKVGYQRRRVKPRAARHFKGSYFAESDRS